MPLNNLITLALLSSTLVQSPPDWPDGDAPLVRALSALDGVAALQTKDGEIQMIHVGDEMGTDLRVVKVLEDRLVVEGTEPGTGEPVTYWIYRAAPSEKKSRILAFGRKGPTRTAASPQESTGIGESSEPAAAEPGDEGKTRPKKNPQ